jgi:hypothetical protein
MGVLKYSLVEFYANRDFRVNTVWSASVNIEFVTDSGHFGLYNVLARINIHEFHDEIMRRIKCGDSRLFSSKHPVAVGCLQRVDVRSVAGTPTMKMKAVCSSQTSVTHFISTRYKHSASEIISLVSHRMSIKSVINYIYVKIQFLGQYMNLRKIKKMSSFIA